MLHEATRLVSQIKQKKIYTNIYDNIVHTMPDNDQISDIWPGTLRPRPQSALGLFDDFGKLEDFFVTGTGGASACAIGCVASAAGAVSSEFSSSSFAASAAAIASGPNSAMNLI